MDGFQSWVIENIGMWVVDYSALILVIAVALLLILLLTFIIVACRHAHNNKKFRKMKAELARAQEGAGDSGEQSVESAMPPEAREEELGRMRAEVEAELRAEYEARYANMGAANDGVDVSMYTERIAELTAENDEKQRTIDALTAANVGGGSDGDGELRAQLEELRTQKNEEALDYRIKISELREKNNELASEINLLKAENAQIKAQALQQQLAQRTAETKTRQQRAATAEKPEPATQRAAQTKPEPAAAKQSAQMQPDEEDEYDEYYDDYGDENSAVKVTLKFDRAKQNWVILRTDTDRAYRRIATKQEALVIAKDLARRLHAQLVVHKKDGKFQRI